MKAITCKYFGPTNTKGSRIWAQAEGVKSLSIPYPHELSGDDVYAAAALALARRQGWTGNLIAGGTHDGKTVFVFAESNAYTI
jgi:hypothetical protein